LELAKERIPDLKVGQGNHPVRGQKGKIDEGK
jgi:hypothetical protein